MRSRARHLIVALHERSWGRTEIAQRIASELRRNREVWLLARRATEPLCRLAGTRYTFLENGSRAQLAREISKWNPTSVIHCDLESTWRVLGQDPALRDIVARAKAHVIDVDVWQRSRTGWTVDLFGRREARPPIADPEAGSDVRTIVPVPIGRVDARSTTFQCLPETRRMSRKRRPRNDRTIILFTALWQHDAGGHPDGVRIARLVPELLARVIRDTRSQIRLLHVGPRRLPLQPILGDRYIYRTPVDPRQTDELILRADLMVSLNFAASTISRALCAGTPVLFIQNSRAISDAAQVPTASDAMSNWLRRAAPIYPFRVWPIGYYDFLSPLAEHSELLESFRVAELTDEDLSQTIESLLFDQSEGDRMRERMLEYVDHVRGLASVRDVEALQV